MNDTLDKHKYTYRSIYCISFIFLCIIIILPGISYMPRDRNEYYAIIRGLRDLQCVDLGNNSNLTITVIPGKPIDKKLDLLLERLLVLNIKGVKDTDILCFIADNTEVTDSTLKIVLSFKNIENISIKSCNNITDNLYIYVNGCVNITPSVKRNIISQIMKRKNCEMLNGSIGFQNTDQTPENQESEEGKEQKQDDRSCL